MRRAMQKNSKLWSVLILLFWPLFMVNAQKVDFLQNGKNCTKNDPKWKMEWHIVPQAIDKGAWSHKIIVTFNSTDPNKFIIDHIEFELYQDKKLTKPFLIECYANSGEPMTGFTTDMSKVVKKNKFLMSGKDYGEYIYFIPYESLQKHYYEQKDGSNSVVAYINTIIYFSDGTVVQDKTATSFNDNPAYIGYRFEQCPPERKPVIEDLGTDDLSGLLDEETDESCLNLPQVAIDLLTGSYGQGGEGSEKIMNKYKIGICEHKAPQVSPRFPDPRRHNNYTLAASIYNFYRDRCYADDCLIHVNSYANPKKVVFTLSRGYSHVCDFLASLISYGFVKKASFDKNDYVGEQIHVDVYSNIMFRCEVVTYNAQRIIITFSYNPEEESKEPEPREPQESQEPQEKPDKNHRSKIRWEMCICDYNHVDYDGEAEFVEDDILTVKTLDPYLEFKKIRPSEVVSYTKGLTIDSMLATKPVTEGLWAQLFPEKELSRGCSVDDETPILNMTPNERALLLIRLKEKAGFGDHVAFAIARSKLLKDGGLEPAPVDENTNEEVEGNLTVDGLCYLVAVPLKSISSFSTLFITSYHQCIDKPCDFNNWPMVFYTNTYADHHLAVQAMNKLAVKYRARGDLVITSEQCEDYGKKKRSLLDFITKPIQNIFK